jgi:hypothetical protein
LFANGVDIFMGNVDYGSDPESNFGRSHRMVRRREASKPMETRGKLMTPREASRMMGISYPMVKKWILVATRLRR